MKNIVIVVLVALILASCTFNPKPLEIEEEHTSDPQENKTIEATSDLQIQDRLVLNGLKSNDGSTIFAILHSSINWQRYLPTKYDIENLSIDKSGEVEPVDEYIRRLNIAFMSGDASFDLYAISSYSVDLLPILEQGYFYDLSQDVEISSQFDLTFEEIRDISTYKDKIFGIPGYLYPGPFTMVFDKNILDKYNITDVPNTYEEIFEFQKTLSGNDKMLFDGNNIEFGYLMNIMYSAFDEELKHIDFDSIDLDKYKIMYKEEIEKCLVYDVMDYISQSDVIGFQYSMFLEDKINYENPIYVPIYLDEDIDKRYTSGFFILINPYSTKIELALDYLNDVMILQKTMKKQEEPIFDSYYANNPIYFMYKDENTYKENELGFTPAKNAKQEFLDEVDIIYTDLGLFNGFSGYEECREILLSYFNDEIDLVSARVEMQGIMDTVSREYTLD